MHYFPAHTTLAGDVNYCGNVMPCRQQKKKRSNPIQSINYCPLGGTVVNRLASPAHSAEVQDLILATDLQCGVCMYSGNKLIVSMKTWNQGTLIMTRVQTLQVRKPSWPQSIKEQLAFSLRWVLINHALPMALMCSCTCPYHRNPAFISFLTLTIPSVSGGCLTQQPSIKYDPIIFFLCSRMT